MNSEASAVLEQMKKFIIAHLHHPIAASDMPLDFVFDTQEGFTDSFINGCGISPTRFAIRPTLQILLKAFFQSWI